MRDGLNIAILMINYITKSILCCIYGTCAGFADSSSIRDIQMQAGLSQNTRGRDILKEALHCALRGWSCLGPGHEMLSLVDILV